MHTYAFAPAVPRPSTPPLPAACCPPLQIRVYCRVRPHPAPGGAAVRCNPDGSSVVLSSEGKDHAFAYDRVFGPASSQVQGWARQGEGAAERGGEGGGQGKGAREGVATAL